MEPISFVAASAEEAVAQIRARLGPEAVVLNVRPLPAQGLARLWQKPMIEVLAYCPESPPAPAAPLSEALAEFRQRLGQIEQHVKSPAGKNGGRPGRPAGIRRSHCPFGLRGLAHRRGAAKDRPAAASCPARSGRSAAAAWRDSARLARGGNRAGARLSGGRLAALPAVPGAFGACGDRAGGVGQNDVPLQMAYPGGVGGRAVWRGCGVWTAPQPTWRNR